jgi:hypothetical protein
VAAAAHRDRKVSAAREANRGGNVRRARAAGEHGRETFVVCAVSDPARLVVPRIGQREHLATYRLPQLLERRLAQSRRNCRRHARLLSVAVVAKV